MSKQNTHHKGGRLPNEATALQELVSRYDAIEAEIHELRHDSDGNQLETLDADATARIATLETEVDEVRAGMVRESERVRMVREIAEARRQASLATGDGSGVSASVEAEPMVYGGDETYRAKNSWWADFVTYHRGEMAPGFLAARERLLKWGQQVEREVADDTHVGQKFEAQLREQFRDKDGFGTRQRLAEVRERGRAGAVASDAELRAISGVGTGGGPTVAATSGASSFITPVFVGPYVPYRQYGRAFADQCEKPALPDYGMGIYKPVVDSGAGFGTFTELGTVTEVDPTVGYLAGSLGIYAGDVTLSQAVLDRTAPDYRYDLMVQDQIQRKESPVLDLYVINQAITNGATALSYTGTFAVGPASPPGVGGFQGEVGQAKKTMRKTQGAVLNPTHLWLDPAPLEYILNWVDSQGRPLAVPDYASPFNALAAGSADGDAGIEGASGYKFNALRMFGDANIPTTGGTANLYQALVTCQNEIEYYEGEAYNRILPQTLATNLATVVQRYRYVTVIVNYAAAVQPIQGSAFGSITW